MIETDSNSHCDTTGSLDGENGSPCSLPPSRARLWRSFSIGAVVTALILSSPFHIFDLPHRLSGMHVYGNDLMGVCKSFLALMMCPSRVMRLMAVISLVLLPLVACRRKDRKCNPLALAAALIVPFCFAFLADVLATRAPAQNNEIDYSMSLQAYDRFALRKYNIPEQLVAAEIRQEQGALSFKDQTQDRCVALFGDTPAGLDMTIGPAQMKKSNIIALAKQFPEQFSGSLLDEAHRVNLKAALENKTAMLLVAAYYKSVILRIESGRPACLDQSAAINARIATLWNSDSAKDRVKALAMSYSPGWKNHPQQVLNRLSNIQVSLRKI
jgi:hypothetical protein